MLNQIIKLKTMSNKVKNLLIALGVIILAIIFMPISCERIDAGHEGVLVNLYGDDKGVGDVSMCTGMVWYNPYTRQVFEYPTFAQTIDYDAFEVNSKDGTKFTIDPSMLVKIEDGKSPQIFKKYRKNLDEVINGALYIYVKDAARIVFNDFTADSIVSNRAMVDRAFDMRVREAFAKEGFVLEQLTPGISYPKSYEEAINAKNKAIQDEMRVINEIKVAEAKSKKTIITAEAEAQANRLKTQALSPQVLEAMWIEKWNGKLPVYGTTPTLFKDIAKK